jgi:hypothetical protein
MTLTDPRDALAEQSNFIGYLMGLASLGRVVHELADSDCRAEIPSNADEFVYVLLGIASLGDSIERLAKSAPAQGHWGATASVPDSTNSRWLR